MSGGHSDQTAVQGIHVVQAYEFANAADRLALSATPSDIGRVARQVDTGAFYILESDSPLTWVQLGAGGGSAPVFGSEAAVQASATVSTNVTTGFQNKVTLDVNAALGAALVGGVYRVGFHYSWNHDDGGSDFEARFQEDGVDMGEIHKQEPKDSAGTFGATGTSQRHLASKVFYQTLSAGSTPVYTLDYRTDLGGAESSVWDALIEFWRFS